MSIYFASIFILWGAYASQNLEQNDNDTRKQMYLSQQTNNQNDDIEEFTLDEGIKVNASQFYFEDEKDDLEQIDLRFFNEHTQSKSFADLNIEDVEILREDQFDDNALNSEQMEVLIQSMQNLNNFEVVPNKTISMPKIRNQIVDDSVTPTFGFVPIHVPSRFLVISIFFKLTKFIDCTRKHGTIIILSLLLFFFVLFALVIVIEQFMALTLSEGE
jgi:hypothetical protein